jgi:hypothetical protein
MSQLLNALSSTVLIYASVTRGSLVVAHVLERLTRKSPKAPKGPLTH